MYNFHILQKHKFQFQMYLTNIITEQYSRGNHQDAAHIIFLPTSCFGQHHLGYLVIFRSTVRPIL